jgi:nitrogen fixation protein NifB
MPLDLTQHPCFNKDVRHQTGRIHLPVAPRCNIQCNYCNRKFDCMNESRPGVTSAVLKPDQALAYLDEALLRAPHLRVVGIAGPGDPFAKPEDTLETLRLVRDKYPEMLLCVASNGLNLEPHVAELARLQVSHVTVTINTVDPEIGAQIYAWVRDGKTIYRGAAAASILLERQLSAVAALKAAGITVKINTILVPGVNEDHAPLVAERMRELGVDVMNCIPVYPVKDTPFEDKDEISTDVMREIRAEISAIVPQMEHCTRCRADAVGLLGEEQSAELVGIMQAAANGLLDDRKGRPYVAVASMEGILVNQHLGEATRLWIMEYQEGEPKLIELRYMPETGGGNARWREMAESLEDCHSVIVSGVGRAPRWVMEQSGLRVLEVNGLISDAMESLHHTGDVPAAMKKQFKSCSTSACQGTGTGCS